MKNIKNILLKQFNKGSLFAIPKYHFNQQFIFPQSQEKYTHIISIRKDMINFEKDLLTQEQSILINGLFNCSYLEAEKLYNISKDKNYFYYSNFCFHFIYSGEENNPIQFESFVRDNNIIPEIMNSIFSQEVNNIDDISLTKNNIIAISKLLAKYYNQILSTSTSNTAFLTPSNFKSFLSLISKHGILVNIMELINIIKCIHSHEKLMEDNDYHIIDLLIIDALENKKLLSFDTFAIWDSLNIILNQYRNGKYKLYGTIIGFAASLISNNNYSIENVNEFSRAILNIRDKVFLDLRDKLFFYEVLRNLVKNKEVNIEPKYEHILYLMFCISINEPLNMIDAQLENDLFDFVLNYNLFSSSKVKKYYILNKIKMSLDDKKEVYSEKLNLLKNKIFRNVLQMTSFDDVFNYLFKRKMFLALKNFEITLDNVEKDYIRVVIKQYLVKYIQSESQEVESKKDIVTLISFLKSSSLLEIVDEEITALLNCLHQSDDIIFVFENGRLETLFEENKKLSKENIIIEEAQIDEDEIQEKNDK